MRFVRWIWRERTGLFWLELVTGLARLANQQELLEGLGLYASLLVINTVLLSAVRTGCDLKHHIYLYSVASRSNDRPQFQSAGK